MIRAPSKRGICRDIDRSLAGAGAKGKPGDGFAVGSPTRRCSVGQAHPPHNAGAHISGLLYHIDIIGRKKRRAGAARLVPYVAIGQGGLDLLHRTVVLAGRPKASWRVADNRVAAMNLAGAKLAEAKQLAQGVYIRKAWVEVVVEMTRMMIGTKTLPRHKRLPIALRRMRGATRDDHSGCGRAPWVSS